MWIPVSRIEHAKLSPKTREARTDKESGFVRERVKNAREIQKERFKNSRATLNANIGVKEIDSLIPLNSSVRNLLVKSAEKLDLSARSYHRVIKLARTIADLDHCEEVKESHLLEALQYRPKQFLY